MTTKCPECKRDDFRNEDSLRRHMYQQHPVKWKNKYSNTRELQKNLLQEWRNNVKA